MLTKFPFLNLKNIFVSPSGGIDSSVFYPTNYNCVKKSEILRVGFVSRIDKGKGWDVFLESLFILKSKGIIFSAVIAGNGAQVEIMKDEIKSLRLTDDVLYLGGLKQEELRIVYNDIDIFVFSSKEVESLGLVGIEAMSCGIPIIACDSAGPKTYVNDNINSFLVKPGSSSEVAEALIKFKNMSLLEKDKIKREALNTAKLFNSILVGDSLCAKLTTLCIK